VFSNGKGSACIVFQWTAGGGGCPTSGPMVRDMIASQCSSDGGATWTAPVPLVIVPYAGSVAKVNPTGAVSPSGSHVAITFTDENEEVQIFLSQDGGRTFGGAIGYPSASRSALLSGSYTGYPTVAWENDQVLWLAQSIDYADVGKFVMVDKTCDFGATWSGAVDAADDYVGAGLVLTSSGMVAGGVYDRGSDPKAAATIALAPGAP
jgi:hypothetical protein